jgi:hypothetical protein
MSVSYDPPGRRVVELLCAPAWFYGWIDPNDTDYNFPIEVWEGVCHYSICVLLSASVTSEAAGGRRPYQFKGGRYGLGKHLQGEVLKLYRIDGCGIACGDCERFIRSIQFFSLGRICQLIQFTISTGILRYEENLLQPTVSCKLPSSALASRLLPQCIEPEAGSTDICQEISSYFELKMFVDLLFERENADQMPLSQLKKKMIGSFQRVLNPARLGHVKLSQVLEKLDYPFTVVTIGNNTYLCRDNDRRCEPLTPSTVASSSSSARDA